MPPRKDFKPPRETDGPTQRGGIRITVEDESNESRAKTSAREHPMKKMQAKSHDGHGITLGMIKDTSATLKLSRSNDLLAQSSTETLLDMLKAHAGIKECSDETVVHINGVGNIIPVPVSSIKLNPRLLLQILTELYSRVKGARGRWRCAVLGALYGLVECSSSKILLSVARVVLAVSKGQEEVEVYSSINGAILRVFLPQLRVTGSNLTGACKLIFKVARNETNDALFMDCDVAELLIEGLGRASPVEEPEACVYGYGAVRFLANSHLLTTGSDASKRNKCLAYRLAHHGAVQLMVVHLQILNEAGREEALSGAPLHALFQLSSALRALAGNVMVIEAVNKQQNAVSFTTTATSDECPQIKESLEGYDIQMELAGPHLVKSAEICMTDTETQFNLVRTLSALSDIDKCCGALADYAARLAVLLGPCPDDGETSKEKPLGLLSRLGYVLGNIVGKYDSARVNVSVGGRSVVNSLPRLFTSSFLLQIFNNDVAMEHLVNTLDHYSQRPFDGPSTSGADDTIVDVAVKLVRVIANMGVNAEVGHGLVKRVGLGNCLLNLIEKISNILITKQPVDIEELLLASLGALHNLSFYHDANPSEEQQKAIPCRGTVNERISDLSAALVKILQYGNIPAQAEAARVLGNMSRSHCARESICHAGGLKILIKNFESEDFELVASSCGVMVNILGDWERRARFRELKGPLMLRDVLQRSAQQEDWLLAAIVCQALWNYMIDTTDLVAALGEDEADYIVGDLMQYLEEGGGVEGSNGDELYEQFCTVASDLLERIQTSISLTNSPTLPADEVVGGNGLATEDTDDFDVSGQIGDKWKGPFKEWLEQ